MNRRLFLRSLGTATGALFLPDNFLLKVERFLETEYRPLLTHYTDPYYTILCTDFGTLHIGNPYQGPEYIPTWREFFIEKRGFTQRELTKRFLEDYWELSKEDLNRRMNEEHYWSWWLRNESSAATAYRFLEPLDIGPEFSLKGELVGKLQFFDGPFPGSDSLYAEIDGDLTLSCLQWRLRQLGYKCNFEVVDL